MGLSPEYKVNEDGSVTRIGGDVGGNNNNNNNNNNNRDNNGGSSRNGCIWGTVVLIATALIKTCVDASDDSGYYPYEEEAVAVEEVAMEEEVPYEVEASYISVSSDEIYFDADGGSRDISVYTDGDWGVYVNTDSWGHVSAYSSYLTLTVQPNNSSEMRTDYFVIRAGDETKRINITQYGKSTPSPSATITKVWVDHNVYNNGSKGMKIHFNYQVDNMKDQTVHMYTNYYYSDNATPLKNRSGSNLQLHSTNRIPYDNTTCSDYWHFISYYDLNMQSGYGSIDLSFDVVLKDSDGTIIAIDENNRFTLTEN